MKLQKQKLKKYGPVIIGPFLFLIAMSIAQIDNAAYFMAIAVGVVFGIFFDKQTAKNEGRERFSFLNFFLRTREYLYQLIKLPRDHFAFRIINVLIPFILFSFLSFILDLEFYSPYLLIGGIFYEIYYQVKRRCI